MKDEITPTDPEIIGIIRFSEEPPTFRIKAATLLIIPVLSRPAPIIITATIEITALLENPSNRWAGSTNPSLNPIIGASKLVNPNNTIIEIAAISTSTISNANK